MAACGVSMVGGFLVLSALMMLRRFSVVARGIGMVFRCLPMVFRCFFGHNIHLRTRKARQGSRAEVLTVG
jgi:SNF family Na+-dependent transporter